MSEKTVICHLGAHKTATSLIQKYFADKRKEYRKLGVSAIPREDISKASSWGTKVVSNPKALRNLVSSHLDRDGIDYALMSYEDMLRRPFIDEETGLYPRRHQPLQAMADALKGYKVKLVYFIRPQVDFVPSYYVQLIQEGGYFTFEQFLEKQDLDQLSWQPVVDSFVKTFGEDNVHIGDFRTIKEGQEKFLKRFVEALMPGVDGDYEYGSVHNVGLSARGLHIALRINPLLKRDKATRETRKVRNFLQENFSSLNEPKPVLLSEEVREQLMRYSGEYDQIIKRYGLGRQL